MNRTNSLTALLVSAPLLLVAGCGGLYDLPCVYTGAEAPEDPTPELSEHPGCAGIDPDGRPRIAPSHLVAAQYDDGLASMFIAGDWYYVQPDGTPLRVITYDNGPDYWAEGLVRLGRNGKIAYADRDFEVVIPPRYDWRRCPAGRDGAAHERTEPVGVLGGASQ